MAINFINKDNKQKYLIGLLAIILVGIIFVWKKDAIFSTIAPPSTPFQPQQIQINFNVLKSPILSGLQPYGQIPAFSGQPGQEDPFVTK